MSQKKETLSLLLSLVLTSGLSFGAFWFLMEHWARINNNRINNNSSTTNSTNQNPSNNIINPNSPPVSDCKIPNLPQGIFSYGGSTTWAPIRRDVDSVLKNSCPQFDLRYTQPINEKPGSGTGIKMLIANQLAFSQSSRPVKPEENETAKTKGFSLKEITVAIDGIAIAVNHNLNIPGLTVSQLKDIYTGKITNWQQVGGENLPIIPLSRSKESGGSVDFFVENVLNKEDFKNVNYIGTTTEAIRKVAITPGAIYYASAPEIVPQCIIKSLAIGQTTDKFVTPYKLPAIPRSQCLNQRNQLNTEDIRNGNYPITRNLFVIVKQNGQTDQQAGEAYANWLTTPQNQELIEKAGFVRIK
ncbi:PstS family phosphate ABC transporter substrate-binding protein [Aphanizomenon flos-aquae NRERC-008]|jgi:phosphate transport system substrate-binding protein|uniref:PstS family phosphate ABC transporter substrate-binding protein n=1 Tax=Aphanizomenon flos-aquae FACHB-1249 TaxID=2692889 RepID=A0ABR8ITE7_APHFL|nr:MULTISPECIES: PstS family phosphate ABC transporter substrate-binding protein [Aphanizomenon]MCE2904889.1 PstS family phosphate ABC transporter substrate-binding protein [Anabaena sp. CoA2_C59]MBD2389174.1 PstS family phosphate ABC transporter substrate-binding protein [Aphanizomenon flos-aquae FACHB-1171]MBD2556268.1 PstS family phosphate ABC transporter substrate-binding protein [Aphanizomenon flos-aquae FACHB-1290]MBD2632771.1 PstS family phosphate ABC transporter substrate-binding protei